MNLKYKWFVTILEDNTSELPNNKPSISQQSAKTTLPPNERYTNSFVNMSQQSAPNVYRISDNEVSHYKPDIKNTLVNKGVCTKKPMFCSWNA